MKIGIIGTGNVGRHLAKGFAKAGHQVVLGTRKTATPDLKMWLQQVNLAHIKIVPITDIAEEADIIVLAVLWEHMDQAITASKLNAYKKKIIIDPSNAIVATPVPHLLLKNTSAAETIQKQIPDNYVVKAFNTLYVDNMTFPAFKEAKPIMFIAGDTAQAKQTVQVLLQSVGWECIHDAGPLKQSRYIEALSPLMIHYQITHGALKAAFSIIEH